MLPERFLSVKFAKFPSLWSWICVYPYLFLAADAPQLERDGRLDELVDAAAAAAVDVLVEGDGALVQEPHHVPHRAVRDPLHLQCALVR